MRRSGIALVALLLSGGAAQAAEYKISIRDMSYAPAQVSAKLGDTLVFVNEDSKDHNVFVPTAGFGLNLGTVKPGQSAQTVLRQPGRFEVECGLHPGMSVRVIVE
jgi:cytochrome c peroxidase